MYGKIIIAVDLDEPKSWTTALPVTIELARCFQASLTLCTVITDMKADIEAEWSAIGYRKMIETARARLKSLAAGHEIEIGTEVGTGSVAGGILDCAGRVSADLLVLSSHRPGRRDYLLGANVLRVLRGATCSVLVVRETP